jgi:hypothetical protein
METIDVVDNYNRLKYTKLKKLVEENNLTETQFCNIFVHPFLVGKEFYDGYFAPVEDILTDHTIRFNASTLRNAISSPESEAYSKLKKESMARAMYLLAPTENGEISIGRKRDNNIVMLDFALSKQHAKIIVKTDGYWIVDLNSTNGTTIKNKKAEANKEVRIEIGDTICFGQRFSFVLTKPRDVYKKIVNTTKTQQE